MLAIVFSSVSCVTLSKQAEETFKRIGDNAIWAPIVNWSNGTVGSIDLNSLERYPNGFSAWITSTVGWKRITVDCVGKKSTETWTHGGEIKNLRTDYPFSKRAANDGIVIIADKVCDHFSPSLGSTLRFLGSTTSGLTYHFPAKAVREGAIIKTVQTNVVPYSGHPLPVFNPDAPNYWPMEISCSESKFRSGADATWTSVKDVDTSVSWKPFGEKSPLKAAQRQLCSDPSIINVVLPTTASKNETTSSLDEAKRKCSDLGFQSKSQAFGDCVLKLSK